MTRLLLGFDARETFLDPSVAWGDARRQAYLLARDTPKPYSVDVLVWPSVFGDGIVEGFAVHAVGHVIATSAWRGPNAPLWEDLGALRTALVTAPRSEYLVVAVSEIVPEVTTSISTRTSGLEPAANPTRIDPSWPLLGYDVADASLLSGLMNCGYSRGERSRLVPRWAGRLNDHDLFFDVDDAERFRADAAKRVPQHAPFFVFELRTIP